MQEAVVYVDNCTNITNNTALEFSISPNPNNGTFDIVMPILYENTKVEILDLSGKIIFSEKLSQKKQRLDINNISRGVYILSLNQNGIIKTNKLIIK